MGQWLWDKLARRVDVFQERSFHCWYDSIRGPYGPGTWPKFWCRVFPFFVGTELSLYGLSPHARAAPELYSFGNKAIRMLSGLCAFAIALRMLCDSVAGKILLRVYCIRTTVVELHCYDRAGLEMFFSSEPAGRRREGDPDREVAERPPHDPDRDQRGREAFA